MIISSRNFENIKTDSRLLYISTIIIIIIFIIIIIIIIISTINANLEGNEKATGWEGDFTSVNMFLDNNFFVCLFVFWSFSCKKNFFLAFII